jgi:hypothetical protein
MSIYWGLFMAELGTMLTVWVDLIMQWLLGSGIGEWIEQMLVKRQARQFHLNAAHHPLSRCTRPPGE